MCVLSSDGKLVAIASLGTIRVWIVESGEELLTADVRDDVREVNRPWVGRDCILNLCFEAQDRRLLAVVKGSRLDGPKLTNTATVRVWDIGASKEMSPYFK